MFGVESSGSPLDTIAHVIQMALTLVFCCPVSRRCSASFRPGLGGSADWLEAVSQALQGADAVKATTAPIAQTTANPQQAEKNGGRREVSHGTNEQSEHGIAGRRRADATTATSIATARRCRCASWAESSFLSSGQPTIDAG